MKFVKMFSVFMALMLALMASSLGVAAAGGPGGRGDNVTFCHATNSVTNPYVVITTDPDSIVKQGHGEHDGPVFNSEMTNRSDWGDIIPPFSYEEGGQGSKATPTVVIFSGKNIPAGAGILANNCEIPVVVVEPPVVVPPVVPDVVVPPVVETPVVVPPVVEAPVVTPPVDTAPVVNPPVSNPPVVAPPRSQPNPPVVKAPVTVIKPTVKVVSQPKPVVVVAQPVAEELPFTGGETELLALIGGLLVMSGAGTMALTRRK